MFKSDNAVDVNGEICHLDNQAVSAFQDIIVVYSCIKGKYSVVLNVCKLFEKLLLKITFSTCIECASPRDIYTGTWFCNSLVKKLKKLHNKTHFEKIMKAVAKDLIKKNKKDSSAPKNIFVTPEVENIGFTKYLYFNK